MTQKKSMNSFYLSEYFVISFLCTIFANIKRTIKKHPRFSTIIIDTIPIHPLHSLSYPQCSIFLSIHQQDISLL